jgi:hypothetical protein
MASKVENLTISKGKLLFRRVETPAKVAWKDLGNAIDVNITIETETLEHFTSRTGLKTRDQLVVLSIKATGAFTLEELTPENLLLFLMGDAVNTNVQASGTGATLNITAVELDSWYELGKTKVSNVVVKDSAETTTYVEGTDYEIDYEAGLIFFYKDVTIIEGAEIHITGFDHEAHDTKVVKGGKSKSIQGDVWFVADPGLGNINDAKGSVTLVPDGEWPLVNDEYGSISFNMEFIESSRFPDLVEYTKRGNVQAG